MWEKERQGRQEKKEKSVGHPGNTLHAARPGAAAKAAHPALPLHLQLPQEKVELGYTDAVDVWAAGILAYELLVRRQRWRGRGPPAGRSPPAVQLVAEPLRCFVGCTQNLVIPTSTLQVGRPPFERETREETYACIAKRGPALPCWMSEGAKQFITATLDKVRLGVACVPVGQPQAGGLLTPLQTQGSVSAVPLLTSLTQTQSARKRPSMAELLRHPWILQHTRRPSTPTASPFHLPLHELAGEGASPFGELHRASLHGAKSCRDFGALLHAPSAGPAGFAGMLSPAATATASSSLSAAAAAVAAVDGASAAARPTTSSSRLGAGGSLGSRPGTPSAALLSTSATASAARAAASPPSASPSAATRAQTPATAATAAEIHQAGSNGVGTSRANQPPPQQHVVAQPQRATSGHGLVAATATADGSFFSAASYVSASSTSASIGKRGGVLVRNYCLSTFLPASLLPPSARHLPSLPAHLAAETSGHSFTHSVAALRALSSSMGLPQAAALAPAAAEPPSGFLVRQLDTGGCYAWC